MAYGIETSGPFIYVTTPIPVAPLDAAAAKLRGKWWAKDRHYSFPIAAEAEVRAIIDTLNVPQAAAPATATTQPTAPQSAGWSNAARRRAGRSTTRVSNELGEGIRSGKGYTMYEDIRGNGRFTTQIWDEA